MEDRPIPDPAGQETEPSFGPPSDERDTDALITHVQAQAHRNLTIITVDEDEDGYTVTHRYLSAKDAARLIRARGKPLSRAAKRALYRLGKLRARYDGQPERVTHNPEFLSLVVEHAWTYRDKEGRLPSVDVLVEHLGVGRSTYYEWLTANDLTSSHIKIATSKWTISDGVSYLLSL